MALPMRFPGRLYKMVFRGLLGKVPWGVGYEDSSEVSSRGSSARVSPESCHRVFVESCGESLMQSLLESL